MPVTNALSCAGVALTTAAVTTSGTQVVSDPGAVTTSKKVALNLSNKTSADATVDVVKWDGANAWSIATGQKIAANSTLTLLDIFLTNGWSIRARASAAATIDCLSDVITHVEA